MYIYIERRALRAPAPLARAAGGKMECGSVGVVSGVCSCQNKSQFLKSLTPPS